MIFVFKQATLIWNLAEFVLHINIHIVNALYKSDIIIIIIVIIIIIIIIIIVIIIIIIIIIIILLLLLLFSRMNAPPF